MAKVKPQQLNANQHRRLLQTLACAVAHLRTPEAAADFLRHLLTPSERVMLGRRLLVARLLAAGHAYEEIRAKLGVGLTTVQAVDAWLRVTAKDYLYADERKRHRRRPYLTRKHRRQLARQARARTPAGIFWLVRSLENAWLGDELTEK